MVIMLLPIKHAENDFGSLKVVIFMWRTKSVLERSRAFEDEKLQALVDEDLCQTQTQLAEALNCAQSIISDRLKALGKVYKERKMSPI